MVSTRKKIPLKYSNVAAPVPIVSAPEVAPVVPKKPYWTAEPNTSSSRRAAAPASSAPYSEIVNNKAPTISPQETKEEWERNYQAFKEYTARVGMCFIPADSDHPLAQWTTMQRVQRLILTKEQLAKLDELGFQWNVKTQDRFDCMYAKLKKYHERYGDCLVPARWKDDPKLGKWVSRQREGQNTLSKERKQKLDALGFVWRVKEWHKRKLKEEQRHEPVSRANSRKHQRDEGYRKHQRDPSKKQKTEAAAVYEAISQSAAELDQLQMESKQRKEPALAPRPAPKPQAKVAPAKPLLPLAPKPAQNPEAKKKAPTQTSNPKQKRTYSPRKQTLTTAKKMAKNMVAQVVSQSVAQVNQSFHGGEWKEQRKMAPPSATEKRQAELLQKVMTKSATKSEVQQVVAQSVAKLNKEMTPPPAAAVPRRKSGAIITAKRGSIKQVNQAVSQSVAELNQLRETEKQKHEKQIQEKRERAALLQKMANDSAMLRQAGIKSLDEINHLVQAGKLSAQEEWNLHMKRVLGYGKMYGMDGLPKEIQDWLLVQFQASLPQWQQKQLQQVLLEILAHDASKHKTPEEADWDEHYRQASVLIRTGSKLTPTVEGWIHEQIKAFQNGNLASPTRRQQLCEILRGSGITIPPPPVLDPSQLPKRRDGLPVNAYYKATGPLIGAPCQEPPISSTSATTSSGDALLMTPKTNNCQNVSKEKMSGGPPQPKSTKTSKASAQKRVGLKPKARRASWSSRSNGSADNYSPPYLETQKAKRPSAVASPQPSSADAVLLRAASGEEPDLGMNEAKPGHPAKETRPSIKATVQWYGGSPSKKAIVTKRKHNPEEARSFAVACSRKLLHKRRTLTKKRKVAS